MAMPQRDETIEEIKRLDALLGCVVMQTQAIEYTRQNPPSSNSSPISIK